jgi:ABC-type multidrug transport system fused ATPase/permease subunit
MSATLQLKPCPAAGTEHTGDAAKPPAKGWRLLGSIFRAYKARILITYGLFNLENVLRLAQPFVLGLAIDDLLRSSYTGLWLFAGQHLSFMLIGALRTMYDMRAFTGMYTDLATRLVLEQREQQVPVSRVAARSALSREFVDFFERDVPLVFRSLYSVVGALVVLAWYDCTLVPICLALGLPAYLANSVYARKTRSLNAGLHDEFEREVEVIDQGRPKEVHTHYRRVALWRIKLANWEALNFGVMEVFVLGLMVTALFRSCLLIEAGPGDIFAVFRYVLMFVMGLDSVPGLVRQFTRLRDIGQRLGYQGPHAGAAPKRVDNLNRLAGNPEGSTPGEMT